MNKKGYTLMELLAVIVIIGLIAGIATIAYTRYIKSARDRVYYSYMDEMHEAVIMYLTNYNVLNNTTERIPLSSLNINSIINPDNPEDKCTNSYVDATRNDKDGMISYDYNVCLKCPNSNFDECKEYTN